MVFVGHYFIDTKGCAFYTSIPEKQVHIKVKQIFFCVLPEPSVHSSLAAGLKNRSSTDMKGEKIHEKQCFEKRFHQNDSDRQRQRSDHLDCF
jgi:hypothetical protein